MDINLGESLPGYQYMCTRIPSFFLELYHFINMKATVYSVYISLLIMLVLASAL
jgi:hypothetical protein